jgi:hypothetical protein
VEKIPFAKESRSDDIGHCIAASVMIMAYSKMLIFGFFHCTHSNSDVSQTWLNSHLIG